MNRVHAHIRLLVIGLIMAAFSGCLGTDAWEHTTHVRPATENQQSTTYSEPVSQSVQDPQPNNHSGGTADAYPDAEPRYHNTLVGKEHSMRTVNVPLGTQTLRVALTHETDGDASFALWEPTSALPLPHSVSPDPVAKETTDGYKVMDEEEWFLVHDPLPGDWTFTIGIQGCSSYTAGFYIE